MKLSDRLSVVADLVSKNNVLCDVGCDHGYIPIYLIKNGIIPSAIAMDINAGPLERAKAHILEEHLEDKIELRLSNGLEKLAMNEADTVLIAGMGGELIINILEAGKDVLDSVDEVILSPHSEWYSVREYLIHSGFLIVREEMIKDAGKYYVVMKVVRTADAGDEYSKIELSYGRHLLQSKNEILKEYLLNQIDKLDNISFNLSEKKSEVAFERKSEIDKEICEIKEILSRFF